MPPPWSEEDRASPRRKAAACSSRVVSLARVTLSGGASWEMASGSRVMPSSWKRATSCSAVRRKASRSAVRRWAREKSRKPLSRSRINMMMFFKRKRSMGASFSI